MNTEPLMKLNYKPGANGMLYPDIQIAPETERMEAGPYGQAWKTYMVEANPERVSELLMKGQLLSEMAKVDEEAENRKEELIQAMLKKNPMPQTEDTMERAAHMEMLTREADEIVLAEIVYQQR